MADDRTQTAPGPTPGPIDADATSESAWLPDPYGRDQSRYWDGERWTSKVRVEGHGAIEPPVVDPAPHLARLHEPAIPITDAVRPLAMRTSKVPVGMALAFVVMAGIVALIGYGVYDLVTG